MRMVLIVGLGGMLGSMGRYAAGVLAERFLTVSFPAATFIVNLTGCLAIGLIYGASGKYAWLDNDWRLFLATGVCGGYTTFSAFAYENLRLLQNGNYGLFALYSLSGFCLGLLAVWIGMALVK